METLKELKHTEIREKILFYLEKKKKVFPMTGQDMFDRTKCTHSFFVHTYSCYYLTPNPDASYYHANMKQKYFSDILPNH